MTAAVYPQPIRPGTPGLEQQLPWLPLVPWIKVVRRQRFCAKEDAIAQVVGATSVASDGPDAAVDDVTTPTFTPTQGNVLVAFAFAAETGVVEGDLAVSFNANAFTVRAYAINTGAAPDHHIWRATWTVGASPGTFGVRFDFTAFAGTLNIYMGEVVELSGVNTTTNDGEASIDEAFGNASSETGTLTGASGNGVLGAISLDHDTGVITWTSPLSQIAHNESTSVARADWAIAFSATEDATPAATFDTTRQYVALWAEYTAAASGGGAPGRLAGGIAGSLLAGLAGGAGKLAAIRLPPRIRARPLGKVT